jgi:hypothetical protein
MIELEKDKFGLVYVVKSLIDHLNIDFNEKLHRNEYKIMRDIRRKFIKLPIPFYIKNSILEVF